LRPCLVRSARVFACLEMSLIAVCLGSRLRGNSRWWFPGSRHHFRCGAVVRVTGNRQRLCSSAADQGWVRLIMRLRFMAMLVAGIVTLQSLSPAHALSCAPYLNARDYLATIPIILGGVVTETEVTSDGTFTIATVQVSRHIKGTDGDTIRVAAQRRPALGSYTFPVGQPLTVFAYPTTRYSAPTNSVAHAMTDVCTMRNAERVRLDPALRAGPANDLEAVIDTMPPG
jgi:hypothetical protein